jgi:lysozyme
MSLPFCRFFLHGFAPPEQANPKGQHMQERKATLPGLPGIDVSHFQGIIDWTKVKKAGIQFAYLKASEGVDIRDASFARNRAACQVNGIPTGAYHFFRAKDSVPQQVELFVQAIGQLQAGELPPVLDIEAPKDWTSLPIATRSAIVEQWLDEVSKKLNTTAILYIGNSVFTDVLGAPAALASRPLWIAQYPRIPKSQPTFPKVFKTWRFWQHSMTGSVNGISTSVDLDRFNGDLKELQLLLVSK